MCEVPPLFWLRAGAPRWGSVWRELGFVGLDFLSERSDNEEFWHEGEGEVALEFGDVSDEVFGGLAELGVFGLEVFSEAIFFEDLLALVEDLLGWPWVFVFFFLGWPACFAVFHVKGPLRWVTMAMSSGDGARGWGF